MNAIDELMAMFRAREELMIVRNIHTLCTRFVAVWLFVMLSSALACAQASPLPNLAGRWTGFLPTGATEGDSTETVEQNPSDPSRLTFRNAGGSVSRGHFLNATTVIADDWQGGLRGTLENNNRTIRWANSTSWSRSASVGFPLPNLAGRWTGFLPTGASEGDSTETVEQNPGDPSRLTFRNAGGSVSRGHFLNATTVVADDWQGGLRGTLENNNRTIRWANSTSWSRSASAGFGLPNLAGRWTGFLPTGASEGNSTETVEQSPSDPNRLTFRNAGGSVSRGHFLNATTVIADDWQGGLRGTLENNNRTIRWANSTSWSR